MISVRRQAISGAEQKPDVPASGRVGRAPEEFERRAERNPRVGGERFEVDIEALDHTVRRHAVLAQQAPQTRQRSGSLISNRAHDCRH